jgi:hypothetical protein
MQVQSHRNPFQEQRSLLRRQRGARRHHSLQFDYPSAISGALAPAWAIGETVAERGRFMPAIYCTALPRFPQENL